MFSAADKSAFADASMSAGATLLAVEYRPAARPERRDGANLLAVVHFGRNPAPSAADSNHLDITAPFEQLRGAPVCECWTVAAPVARGVDGAVEYALAGDVVAGRLTAEALAPGALESATHEIYRALLQFVERVERRQLLRIWNAVPQINADENGLERYKLFCRARSVAFEEHYGASFPRSLPAASALGCAGDQLVVYFFASRRAPVHHENPRQDSAWTYPRQYGPRGPAFARATVAPAELGGAVLLAGTASVVGHESRHVGDPAAQLDETMRNIEALLGGVDPGAPEPLSRIRVIKVFVRRAELAADIESRLARVVPPGTPVLFLRADICRAELLLEIEGLAGRLER